MASLVPKVAVGDSISDSLVNRTEANPATVTVSSVSFINTNQNQQRNAAITAVSPSETIAAYDDTVILSGTGVNGKSAWVVGQ